VCFGGGRSGLFWMVSFFEFTCSRVVVYVLECTSAVSSDVEGRIYESLKAMDITLITISLRYENSNFQET